MKVSLNNFQKDAQIRFAEYRSAIEKTLLSGWYILGNEVKSFEEEFARYVGVKYCIGVANGLEALQISLMAYNIGRGDEVITTPLSAAATTLAILAVGTKPVFIDIDKNGQINVDLIPEKINAKTKAIMPVDLYGMCCDFENLRKICNDHGLYLIEDAAQGTGSVYKGKKLGSFGDVGCFSFYPTKNLGAFGDGGAIVTNNAKIARLAYQVRDYGQKSKYVHSLYGLNSRLDEIQASILKVKLKFLDSDNRKRSALARRFMTLLKDINDIGVLDYEKMDVANFHLFVIKTKERNKLKQWLEKEGIQTAIHYPLLIPDQKFIKSLIKKNNHFDIAHEFIQEILTLPCHPGMSNEDVDFICKKIKEVID